jgi:hypothetical protein
MQLVSGRNLKEPDGSILLWDPILRIVVAFFVDSYTPSVVTMKWKGMFSSSGTPPAFRKCT